MEEMEAELRVRLADLQTDSSLCSIVRQEKDRDVKEATETISRYMMENTSKACPLGSVT